MKSTSNEIENQIRNAFNCSASLDSLRDAEYADWNVNIIRRDIKSVKEYLPLLLIKELHSDNKTYLMGDHLVFFLKGDLNGKQSVDSDIPEERRWSYDFIKNFHYFFDGITPTQSVAILSWLKDYAYDRYHETCKDDLMSAIQYWTDYAESKQNE
ncbi:MAG: hypothetical protein K8S27_02915 [Candidatus Omnitrophica bacterium]|nr:hypothetical protein [Candidatus Omnitrophota bacterium]